MFCMLNIIYNISFSSSASMNNTLPSNVYTVFDLKRETKIVTFSSIKLSIKFIN